MSIPASFSEPQARCLLAWSLLQEVCVQIVEKHWNIAFIGYNEIMALHQNLWVTTGSGKSPNVWYKAISIALKVLKPQDFLIVNLILVLNPSTIPHENSFFARNQLSIKSRCRWILYLTGSLSDQFSTSMPEWSTYPDICPPNREMHISRNTGMLL